jgi:hypothetical protein
MRDDAGTRRIRAWGLLAAAAVGWAAAAPFPHVARAAPLRGYARVQYDAQDQRGGQADDVEWWLRLVHLDYATRVRDRYDVTAQFEWNDLSYIDRPDRFVSPRGSLRLAHRDFGAYASYHPRRTTDANGVTVRQRETTVTGYLTKPGLPQVQASYVRRFQFQRELTPQQTGTQKSVSAIHTIGALSLRGSYTHLTRETELTGTSRSTQRDWTGGAQWRFQRVKTSGQLSYGIQSSLRKGASGAADRSVVHNAGVNGSRTLARKWTSNLVYSFRRSELSNGADRTLDDHEGNAALVYQATRAISASGGGGLRTARIESRLETERYLFASLAVQGRIRSRWRGAASATRSANWLPGETSRPINNASVSTQMTLWRGFDVTGQSQVTSGSASAAVADTSGQRVRVTAQTTLGFSATPLRPVTIRYSWSEYRTGDALFSPDATSRADQWNVAWNPMRTMQLSGTLSRSRGLGPRDPLQLTKQAWAQWTPSMTVQVSGSYTRSRSDRLDAITQSLLGRESFGARAIVSLTRAWRFEGLLNDVDPGRPSHVRQWNVSLTRSFGR